MGGTRNHRGLRTSRRLMISLGIVGAMTTVSVVGTYALFTASSPTANSTFASANLSITNDQSSGTFLSITNMVPGDSITGIVNVTNAGGEDLASYAVATSLSTSVNALTNDTTNGLRVSIERCAQAWSGSGPTATCGGVRTDLAGTTTAAPLAIAPTGPGTSGSFSLISAGNAFCISASLATERTARGTTCDTTITSGVDHLRIHVSMPVAAGTSLQNLSATVVFTFSGSQPTAHSF